MSGGSRLKKKGTSSRAFVVKRGGAELFKVTNNKYPLRRREGGAFSRNSDRGAPVSSTQPRRRRRRRLRTCRGGAMMMMMMMILAKPRRSGGGGKPQRGSPVPLSLRLPELTPPPASAGFQGDNSGLHTYIHTRFPGAEVEPHGQALLCPRRWPKVVILLPRQAKLIQPPLQTREEELFFAEVPGCRARSKP